MILDSQKSEKIYKAFFASIWSSLHPNIAITTLDTIKFSPKLERKSFAKLRTLQGNCCKHDTLRYNILFKVDITLSFISQCTGNSRP